MTDVLLGDQCGVLRTSPRCSGQITTVLNPITDVFSEITSVFSRHHIGVLRDKCGVPGR
jgi:hypothetical protein